jgi:hypothetical protein
MKCIKIVIIEREDIFVKTMFYMNYRENWKFPKNVSSLTMECKNIHLMNLAVYFLDKGLRNRDAGIRRLSSAFKYNDRVVNFPFQYIQ